MIDIHSHVLPMVDDGSSSVETSLRMLDEAYKEGTDIIFLTPHYAYPYEFINPKEKIQPLFEDLKYIVDREGIPIEIRLGTEFLYTHELFDEYCDTIQTVDNFLLMEFYFDVSGKYILEAVEHVIEKGYMPIIAHPERFEAIQVNHSIAREIKEKGGYLQMNKGSVVGDFGRIVQECVMNLLDEHLITFVGSDAHDTRRRRTSMYEAYQATSYYFGKDYADDIFENNPRRLLNLGEEK